MHEKPVVLGSGLVALDLVLSESTDAPPRMFAGGTCGNVLTILSFLGWTAYPVARLCPGLAAEEIRSDMKKFGVKLDFLARRRQGSTPIIVQRIRRRPDGSTVHRFAWSCPDCGSVLPGYKPLLRGEAAEVAAEMSRPSVFFMDRVSRGMLVLAQKSREQGALVVFEPSGIGDPKLFGEAIELCHVFKHSRERAIQLSAKSKKSGPLLEIETLGGEGLRYRSRASSDALGKWSSVTAFPVRKLVDAAGCGDWCTAGLLYKTGTGGRKGFEALDPSEIYEALRFGQALATWNCQFMGARGGMYSTSRQEVLAAAKLIQAGDTLENRAAEQEIPEVLRCVCPACRRKGRLRTGHAAPVG